MQYFNAVLRPSVGLSQKLVSFAQENFADKADGYCLSERVFPHITLCQFKADKMLEFTLNQILKSPEPIKYNVGTGVEIHKGYVWTEVIIKPEPWLISLHEYAKNKLQSFGAQTITKNYKPHQTFCRLPDSQKDFAENIKLPDVLLKKHEGWTFEIGRSDENGQYFGLEKSACEKIN
jgi:2'-5' RNA ligase